MKEDFLVVIDPGHGGVDPGATFSSFTESQLTLMGAKELKKRAKERGILVGLTREDDAFVSLGDRTKIAEANNADLFVSLHYTPPSEDGSLMPTVYYHDFSNSALRNHAFVLLKGFLQKGEKGNIKEAGFSVLKNTETTSLLLSIPVEEDGVSLERKTANFKSRIDEILDAIVEIRNLEQAD